MNFLRSTPIILEKFDLGKASVELPVAVLKGSKPGPTVIITGGMDGDEYTGIRAAYELIEQYKNLDFPGALVIIPIVNLPGFYAGLSINPLDNKYPKNIFPGNKDGTETERLVHWLKTKYLDKADLWLDLHSGAVSETMHPFVWAGEADNRSINLETKRLLSDLGSEIVVIEKRILRSKANALAKNNCCYIVFEVGEKGEQRKEHIQLEVSWAKQALEVFWDKDQSAKKITYYRDISIYDSARDGIWEPSYSSPSFKRNEYLGTVKSVNQIKLQEVKTKKEGVLLWAKSSPFTNKGDVLVATAGDIVTEKLNNQA